MKKIVLMIAALLMLSTADADAQGFLKKLKQKAQAVVGNVSDNEESEDADDADEADEAESGDIDPSQIAVAQGSDIVPKRKTSTVIWDGVITPSKASTASAVRWRSVRRMPRRLLLCPPVLNNYRLTLRTVLTLRWRLNVLSGRTRFRICLD